MRACCNVLLDSIRGCAPSCYRTNGKFNGGVKVKDECHRNREENTKNDSDDNYNVDDDTEKNVELLRLCVRFHFLTHFLVISKM